MGEHAGSRQHRCRGMRWTERRRNDGNEESATTETPAAVKPSARTSVRLPCRRAPLCRCGFGRRLPQTRVAWRMPSGPSCARPWSSTGRRCCRPELSGWRRDGGRTLGRVKGRARVAYRFDTLNHGGERCDITTALLSHQAEATKGEDATKIAVGAGAGAAIGAILGGGDGAAKGAAIGGAAGTGVVATRGEEVRVGPGASVTTRLTAPLTIRVKIG